MATSAPREMVVALRFQALVDDARKNMGLLRADMQQLRVANDDTTAASMTSAPVQAQLEEGVRDVGEAARQTADALKQEAAAATQSNTASKAATSSQAQLDVAMRGAGNAARQTSEALKEEASAANQSSTASRTQVGAVQQNTSVVDQLATALRRLRERYNEQTQAAAAQTAQLGAQAAAVSRARTATAQGGAALDKYGISAGQTAQAMRMLPMQITDVVTSVASGMPIWMVAIQQGGQIKDSFGGLGPMFSNLVKLITPAKVAFLGIGAALAGLYVIYRNGESELQRFNVAVETTGNYAGATRDKIEALAQEAKNISGISRSSARDIAVGLVQAGQLSMEVISNVTKSARTFAFATGQEVGAAASTLAQAFTDPARGARELDKQFNFLDLSQRQYIDRLVEQGQTEQATLFLSQQLARHMGTTMVENVGVLQRAWHLFVEDLREARDLIADIGRDPTLEEQIEKARANVGSARANVLLYGRNSLEGPRAQAALQKAEFDLAALELNKHLQDANAVEASQQAQLEARKKRADENAKAVEKTLETAQERFEDEKAKLDEALKIGARTQAEYDKAIKRLEQRRDKAQARGQKKPRTDKQLQSDLYSIQQPLTDITSQVDLDAVRAALERQYKPAIDAALKIPGADVEQVKQQVQLIVDAGTAQAEFNARLAEAQRIQADLQLQEASLRQEQQSGAISQIEAEARLRDARAAQAPELQAIVVELERIRDAVPTEAAGTLNAMGAAIGQVKVQAADATPVVVGLGTKLKNSFIDNISNAAGQAMSDFENLGDAIKNTLKNIAGSILSSGIKEALTTVFSSGGGQSSGSGLFGALISGAKSIFGFANGGSPGSGRRYASGGHIQGPGTGTSDSIPAIVDGREPIAVSTDEYIQPQRAVRHYGLRFMEAVRTLKFPKPNVGYALGGLVHAHRQARFATGGQLSGATAAAGQAAPNIILQVTNTGTPQRVERQDARWEGRDMIISVVMSDLRDGGPISRALGSRARG